MCRSISAEGRSVTEKLQALIGTLQPAELSVRPAQLLSGLARCLKGSWIAVLCSRGVLPSVSPSAAPDGPSPAAEQLALQQALQQALKKAIFPLEVGFLPLGTPLVHTS